MAARTLADSTQFDIGIDVAAHTTLTKADAARTALTVFAWCGLSVDLRAADTRTIEALIIVVVHLRCIVIVTALPNGGGCERLTKDDVACAKAAILVGIDSETEVRRVANTRRWHIQLPVCEAFANDTNTLECLTLRLVDLPGMRPSKHTQCEQCGVGNRSAKCTVMANAGRTGNCRRRHSNGKTPSSG